MTFGELLTLHRQRCSYTLREFAEKIAYDPSNISKIERNVISPPRSRLVLRKWAGALDLKEGTDDFATFVAQGLASNIQRRFKNDNELVRLLPAFCRTVENKQLDPETYRRLLAILKQNT